MCIKWFITGDLKEKSNIFEFIFGKSRKWMENMIIIIIIKEIRKVIIYFGVNIIWGLWNYIYNIFKEFSKKK